MAIENRELEPGTKLVAKYKKEEHRAERCSRGRREGQIPAGRREAVQESFVRWDRDHRQGLQRLGLLEHRVRQRPNRVRGIRKLGGNGRGPRKYGNPGANVCPWVPSSTQPEGRGRGTDQALLRRLPEELHRAIRRARGEVPRGAQRGCCAAGRLHSLTIGPDKRSVLRQVPVRGLPFSSSTWFTSDPTSRGIAK